MPKGVYTRKPVAPSVINADGSVSIPLCARDGSIRAYAVVDEEDAAWVSQWRWSLITKGYVARGSRCRATGQQWDIRLHRALLGLAPGDGFDGDHIDRDKLNNRRSNLRVLPKGGNPQNVPSYKGSRSEYRGVTFHHGKWRARIQINRKAILIGYFNNELEAAEAARAARRQHLPYSMD